MKGLPVQLAGEKVTQLLGEQRKNVLIVAAQVIR